MCVCLFSNVYISSCVNEKSFVTSFLRVFCRYEYHWADGTNIKKPIKCSAPKYIDYLMTWVQDQLDDETLFPSKIGIILVSMKGPSSMTSSIDFHFGKMLILGLLVHLS